MAASMLLQAACFLVMAMAVEEEDVPVCPMVSSGDSMAAVVPECKYTCRVSNEYLKEGPPEVAEPLLAAQCPEECPTLAPCSQPRDLRCIIGSDHMEFYL
mmetsp:Transcript_85727/g.157103  ORF Transcript_85727/g.157103 Transcript_85727/m.157103 type:complete len:100 (-) Transcript_85727:19-318(-)